MNPQEYTGVDFLDWLIENSGVIGLAFLAVWRFAQDHLRIKTVEVRLNQMDVKTNDLKDEQNILRNELSVQSQDIKHIESNTTKILEKMEEYDRNILEFWQKYDLKEKK